MSGSTAFTIIAARSTSPEILWMKSTPCGARSCITCLETENYIGAFDIVHAHDWLATNTNAALEDSYRRNQVAEKRPTIPFAALVTGPDLNPRVGDNASSDQCIEDDKKG